MGYEQHKQIFSFGSNTQQTYWTHEQDKPMALSQTLTDVIAFDGAEHAEGLNQPAAVLQQDVQVATSTKLKEKQKTI